MADKCQKLASLNISHSKLRTFDLGLTPNLKKLDLKNCYNLVELHTPIGCLKKLLYLDLSGCLRFKSFIFHRKDDTSCRVDESLEVGPSAELYLIVESIYICSIHPDNNLPKFQFTCSYREDPPSSTRNLEKLLSFGLCACTDLESFSRSICALQRLRKLKLKGSMEAPGDLDQLDCLEELSLSSTKIKHLPDSICMLKHLKSLKLKSCALLEKLPVNLGQLECLEKLTLTSAKVRHFPDSICMLKHLKSLKIEFCWLLNKLPNDLGRLECLEKLTLHCTAIKNLPDSICMLKRLESLELNVCTRLDKLPEDLGRLECLKELILIACFELRHIPNSICKIKCLKHVHLQECRQLEKLPEELGGLECLEVLCIENTCIGRLPQSIHLLKGLCIYGSRELLQSSGFTSEIQTSRYDRLCHAKV